MMWVVRAGQKSIFYEKFIENQRIYIPWEGYRFSLKGITNKSEFRQIVEKEKKIENKTSISNWSGQLYSFVEQMKENDLVLIPTKGSHTYTLAKIKSEYFFSNEDNLCHYRKIEIIEKAIPRSIFPQHIVYSLGTFRTIFKVKQEEEILCRILQWKR